MTQFRLAQEADLPVIKTIVNDAFSPFIPAVGKKPAPMLDDFAKAIREDEIWLAEEEGVCKGLIYLIRKPDYLEYEIVAVHPSWHGQGIGKDLLRFGEAKAREYGYEEIRLFTNQKFAAAVAMYPKYGYDVIDRREEDGYLRVYYRKPIPKPE